MFPYTRMSKHAALIPFLTTDWTDWYRVHNEYCTKHYSLVANDVKVWDIKVGVVKSF